MSSRWGTTCPICIIAGGRRALILVECALAYRWSSGAAVSRERSVRQARSVRQ